eukprot:scaffold353306_cov20-Prasinocladus_malaysianus.AAC.1
MEGKISHLMHAFPELFNFNVTQMCTPGACFCFVCHFEQYGYLWQLCDMKCMHWINELDTLRHDTEDISSCLVIVPWRVAALLIWQPLMWMTS